MPNDLDQRSEAIINDYKKDDVEAVGLAVGRAMVLAREGLHRHIVAEKFAVPDVFDRSMELLSNKKITEMLWASRMLRFLIVDGQINAVANHPGLLRKVVEARSNTSNADLKDWLGKISADMLQEIEFPDPNISFFRERTIAELAQTTEKPPVLSFEIRLGRTLNEIWNCFYNLNPELKNPDYLPVAYLKALDNLRASLPHLKSEIVVPVRGRAGDFVLSQMDPDVAEAIADYSLAKSASMFILDGTARLINPNTPVRTIMDGITRDTFPAGSAPHNGRKEFIIREKLLDRGSLCPWGDTNSSPLASFMSDHVGLREMKIIASAGEDHMGKKDPAGFVRYLTGQYPLIMDHVYRAFGEVAARHQATATREQHQAADWVTGVRVLNAQRGEHFRLN